MESFSISRTIRGCWIGCILARRKGIAERMKTSLSSWLAFGVTRLCMRGILAVKVFGKPSAHMTLISFTPADMDLFHQVQVHGELLVDYDGAPAGD